MSFGVLRAWRLNTWRSRSTWFSIFSQRLYLFLALRLLPVTFRACWNAWCALIFRAKKRLYDSFNRCRKDLSCAVARSLGFWSSDGASMANGFTVNKQWMWITLGCRGKGKFWWLTSYGVPLYGSESTLFRTIFSPARQAMSPGTCS